MKRAFMCPNCQVVVRDTYTEQLEGVAEAAQQYLAKGETGWPTPHALQAALRALDETPS